MKVLDQAFWTLAVATDDSLGSGRSEAGHAVLRVRFYPRETAKSTAPVTQSD